MGEMAGERSRMRFRANGKNHDQYEMEAVDVMTGEVLHRALTDTLIRHKWPEEKPERTDWYLVECVSSGKWHEVVYWKDGCFFIDQRCLRKAFNEAITHWWELPGVTE